MTNMDYSPSVSMASGQTVHLPRLRIISWNLLRLFGAKVNDVADLIERHHPDLLVMQEATEDFAELPSLVGGHFFREPLSERVYGLAAWSPHPLPQPKALPLPVSAIPGKVPPRLAQLIKFGGATFANVHLSHGQFLNRWQLLHIARSLEGPAAIIGDYNAVGPIGLAGYKDVGPREPTHSPTNVISFRLDRCMTRGLTCLGKSALQRGSSDHHPILLDLKISSEALQPSHRDGPFGSFQQRTDRLLRSVVRSRARARRNADNFERCNGA